MAPGSRGTASCPRRRRPAGAGRSWSPWRTAEARSEPRGYARLFDRLHVLQEAETTDDRELGPGEPPPTLAETARRRADLHQALIGVEKAISSPAGGRAPDWSKDVLRALQDLDHAIVEHIDGAERPMGLYEEIGQRAPRLANQIERLRQEHPSLRDITRELIGSFERGSPGDDWPLAEARDDVQRLLGRLVRHRQLGADLVWDAYNLDIGGIE